MSTAPGNLAATDKPFAIYQTTGEYQFHEAGKFYYAPRNFDIRKAVFSRDFDTREQAQMAGDQWAMRFENPSAMSW